jgi:hypothetical protein
VKKNDTAACTGLGTIGGTPIIGSTAATPHRFDDRDDEVGAEHWAKDQDASDAEEEGVERNLSECAK